MVQELGSPRQDRCQDRRAYAQHSEKQGAEQQRGQVEIDESLLAVPGRTRRDKVDEGAGRHTGEATAAAIEATGNTGEMAATPANSEKSSTSRLSHERRHIWSARQA